MKKLFTTLGIIAGLAVAVPFLAPHYQAMATVSNTDSETVTALGDGVETDFTIGFTFQDNDHIKVYLQDESSSPYTRTEITYGAGAGKFTITGGDPGTTVVMGTPPAATERLVIQRVTPQTQIVDYVETNAFPAEDHEEAIDKMVLLIQEVNRDITKKVGLATASDATVPTFPDPLTDRFILYNHAGDDLTYGPGSGSSLSTGDVMYYTAGVGWDVYSLSTQLTSLQNQITAHLADLTNPHVVTASQVGNTVAQWNANKIQDVEVDDTLKSDGKGLTYDAGSGTLIYSNLPAYGVPTVLGNAYDMLRVDPTGVELEYTNLLGTSNQIILTDNATNLTFSTPQDIAATSSPTFDDITLTGLTGTIYSSEVLETSLEEIDASVKDLDYTGHETWTGAGSYYTIAANAFQLDRGGTGYIRGQAVTWAGAQTTAGTLADNDTTWIYIDSSGTIGTTTGATDADFEDYIFLYECLDDATNVICVKENHPYQFGVASSRHLHNNVDSVIRGIGAIITRVATGGGGAAGDREIKIVGADVLEDHGLQTTIPDSAGSGVTWNVYYTNGAGKWIRDAAATELPMKYRNGAGAATALGTGPNDDTSVYVLYVSKDDIEVSTPTYFAVMDEGEGASDPYDSVAEAQAAITAGDVLVATNELNDLEFAQLGYAIIENNGSGGHIPQLIIEKSSFNSVIVGGGATNDASLVTLDTTNFTKLLSASDTSVQLGMDTLDEALTDSILFSNTGGQDYKISFDATDANHLVLQGQTAAVPGVVSLFSNDSDASDSTEIRIYGNGQPTDAVYHYLKLGWIAGNAYNIQPQNSAGANRNLLIGASGQIGQLSFNDNGRIGTENQVPNARFHVSGDDDEIQFIVEGNATQTANLQEWQDSGSTVLASVDASGDAEFPTITTDEISESTGAAEVTVNNELNLNNGSTSAGVLRIFEDSDDGSNKVSIQAQAMAADYTITLPVDDGNLNDVLVSDGAGAMSWTAPGAIGLEWTYNAYSADQVLSSSEVRQMATCSGAGTDITLYACGATEEGQIVVVKRNDASNACTIKMDATGTADRMDGATADRILSNNFDSITAMCDGSDDWFIF